MDGARSYTYDAAGNLSSVTQDGDWLLGYTYDVASRLREVEQPEHFTAYAYTGMGDRRRQTVDGQRTDYLLDLGTPLT